MSGLRGWWASMRGTPDAKRAEAQAMAERSVQEAHSQVASVRDQIQNELSALRRTQEMLRSQLHHQAINNASKSVLCSLTKKLKKIDQSISEKDKLHNNIERERTQLQDTTTNTSVATAMMRSVEAQRSLQKLDLGDHIDLDDMLDDIEENRTDTRTLQSRLANLGGDDIEDTCSDDDDFNANDVMVAMGMSADHKDSLLCDEISEQLNKATFLNEQHFSSDDAWSEEREYLCYRRNRLAQPGIVSDNFPTVPGRVAPSNSTDMWIPSGTVRPKKTNGFFHDLQ
jgi:hypothetical protein